MPYYDPDGKEFELVDSFLWPNEETVCELRRYGDHDELVAVNVHSNTETPFHRYNMRLWKLLKKTALRGKKHE